MLIIVTYLLYYSLQHKQTALHYGSEGGHHETARLLLERGANPNTRDKVSSYFGMIVAEERLHVSLEERYRKALFV